MRVAVLRYAAGEAVTLPMLARVHLVAARYGTTPAAVREWPADDFLDACKFLAITK